MHKEHLKARGTKNAHHEKQLWHGTAVESFDSINKTGFDRGYSGKHGKHTRDSVFTLVKRHFLLLP